MNLGCRRLGLIFDERLDFVEDVYLVVGEELVLECSIRLV